MRSISVLGFLTRNFTQEEMWADFLREFYFSKWDTLLADVWWIIHMSSYVVLSHCGLTNGSNSVSFHNLLGQECLFFGGIAVSTLRLVKDVASSLWRCQHCISIFFLSDCAEPFYPCESLIFGDMQQNRCSQVFPSAVVSLDSLKKWRSGWVSSQLQPDLIWNACFF